MHGHSCAPAPWNVRLMAMGGGRGRRGAWVVPEWGSGGKVWMWGGKGPFFAGGPKVSRGEVRTAILALLAEEPMHGYQIMQELAERSGGVWRPSPGSIYPTLQQLADEGLIRAEDVEGKKVYHLTEVGRAQVDGQDAPPPWAQFDVEVDTGLHALLELAPHIAAAVMQVVHTGTDEQVAKAKEILADTRSRLYRILADDGGDN